MRRPWREQPPKLPVEIREDYITRVTLVDETGRVYHRNDVQVDLQVSDAGKTLKVFVKPDVSALIDKAAT